MCDDEGTYRGADLDFLLPPQPRPIDPACFMAAAYELACQRPRHRHGEEPEWNVDLFDVERRARAMMGEQGAKG